MKKHRLPGKRQPVSGFFLHLNSYIRLDFLNQCLRFGQDGIELIIGCLQNHLLIHKINGYVSNTVNLFYSTLNLCGTVSAVKVD